MKAYKREAVDIDPEEQELMDLAEEIEFVDDEEDDFGYDYDTCPCCNQDWEATYEVEEWIENHQAWQALSEENREKYPRAQTAWEIMTSKLWKVLS